MMEIVFWGRGGEGVKTAAHLLAEAVFLEGQQVLAFPEYGPERSGAPVRAFLKISKEQIKDLSPITKPDFVVIIDNSLLTLPEMKEKILAGANKQTIFLVNAKEKPDLMGKVINLDASSISIKHLEKDFANVVLLGAFVKLSKVVKLQSVLKAVEETFGSKPEVIEPNKKALKEAYDCV